MSPTFNILLPRHYKPSDCVPNNLPRCASHYWSSQSNKKFSYRGVPVYFSSYVGVDGTSIKVGFWHPLTGEEIDVVTDFEFDKLPEILDEKLDPILGKGMSINWK